jgi:hypothetical protein
MKRNLLSFVLILTFTTACANEGISVKDPKTVEEVVSNETATETINNNVKLFITPDEFNSMFKKDEDATQFKDGKFELMDGSIVIADYFAYGTSYVFDYALATFYEGELANLQLDTTVSIEEIEEALGMKFDEIALVEKNQTGYFITFDSMFHETNISVYPFEWQ